VRRQFETFGAGEAGERAIELGLEVVGEVHVGHRTTLTAREMVMVTDERFGQLEPCELSDSRHAMDDALGLEHGEVAVDAARALARGAEDDLVDREGATGGGERFDEIPARPGVPPGVVGEPGRHRIVQVGRHPCSIPPLIVVPVLDSDRVGPIP
jgi:hypothetical protein